MALASFISFFAIKLIPEDKINPNLSIAIAFVFTAVVFFLFKGVLKLSASKKLITKITNLYRNFIDFINKSPFMGKKYTAEERRTEKYKKAIEEQMNNSRRVYVRLLSGHTMYYDDREKFIIDLLKKLTIKKIDERDIKIQLLSRSAASFEERANSYVELMDKRDMPYKCSYTEYLNRCKQIEDNLLRILGKDKVSFYQRKYLWRLHIFDEVIFISIYSDTPEMVEGHLSPIYSFTRECDASLFDGFVRDFESLYKKN